MVAFKISGALLENKTNQNTEYNDSWNCKVQKRFSVVVRLITRLSVNVCMRMWINDNTLLNCSLWRVCKVTKWFANLFVENFNETKFQNVVKYVWCYLCRRRVVVVHVVEWNFCIYFICIARLTKFCQPLVTFFLVYILEFCEFMSPEFDTDYYENILDEDVFESPVISSRLSVKSSVKSKTSHQKRMKKIQKLKPGKLLVITTKTVVSLCTLELE